MFMLRPIRAATSPARFTDSIPDPSAARPHSRPLCVLSAGPKNVHPPNLVDLQICIQRNPP
jgi:hypothetical protein